MNVLRARLLAKPLPNRSMLLLNSKSHTRYLATLPAQFQKRSTLQLPYLNSHSALHFNLLHHSTYSTGISTRHLHSSAYLFVDKAGSENNTTDLDKQEIPRNALYRIFVAECLIFTVFGFFDNFIMMTFGDQIDIFCGSLITHPMVAAAMGNWISDLFGMGTSERVESTLGKVFPAPRLTAPQYASKKFHNWKYGGRFAGITIGCLLGAAVAYPLLEHEDETCHHGHEHEPE